MSDTHPKIPTKKWYKSLLFWLGLPGLGFLLWMWQDTHKNLTEFVWHGDDGSLIIMADSGELDCVHYPFVMNHQPQKASLERYPHNMTMTPSWSIGGFDLPLAVVVTEHPELDQLRTPRIQIAYWLITLIYIIGWLTTLSLWQWRNRRLAAKQAQSWL